MEKNEMFHPADVREFKFARPKCPVGGKLTKSSSGGGMPLRTLSDPSPQVISSNGKLFQVFISFSPFHSLFLTEK